MTGVQTCALPISTTQSPSRVGRRSRTPISGRNILTVQGKDPNFEYRFVNDTGDRVAALRDRDWEPVPASEVRIGDVRIDQASSEGSIAQASVSRNTREKAVLMKIPKEFYQDDQAAKQEHLDQLEQSIRQQALSTNELRSGKPL